MPVRRLHRVALSSMVLAAACSATMAGPNNRTDVTFGDFVTPTSYASVGGTKAWAFGSHTCNIGLDNLAWGGTDGTPAFVSNLYRLHNGRMTMIGMSWAKHSFAVGNSTGICGTCPAGAGAGLRPLCRDLYSAGINGSQARLGPRSLINPFDGTFTARATQPSYTSIERRLQARESDLNPANFPGALYFTEGVYVASDEAPAVQMNNASFRRVTFDAAYNVAVVDTTQRERPAIFAWKEHGLGLNTPDPSVQVVTADFPGEGRVYVAGKASRAPSGVWRYEYMVFNLNSHIGVGGVSVPAGAATVGGIGTFAPTYHSGETVSNDPWLGGASGGNVTWTTPQTFAQNPLTGAIRWGTTHNYWFETATPPAVALPAPAPQPPGVVLSGFRESVTTTAAGLPVPGCAGDFDGILDHLVEVFLLDISEDFGV
ncbi:MAG: hypothetical protein K2Q20_09395, partial [Phycisphaerales bacterium]|nr:hypothetical protein [Phycisphaerales bacterium]